MAEGPLLSIAIPTYNRESCLRLLLESICGQVTPNMAERLEVLAFDNCSTDGTTALVESLVSGHAFLKYVRNEQNIGADANFVKAFFKATGTYLWVIGDDELLFDGAIAWVLGLCARQEFGCAYLYSIPAALSQMPLSLRRQTATQVRCRSYAPYAFAQAADYRLTFLSGSVINRQGVLSANPHIANDVERFSGSNLVHLTWILSAILAKPVSCLVTTPLFASTVANSGGYDPVKVFVVNLSDLFGHYLSGLNPDAKRFIRWFSMIGWFPKVVFDTRFRGRYKGTGYVIDSQRFPVEMQRGVSWWLFERCVLKGGILCSALAMLALKTWHKLAQVVYLARGA